MIIYKTKIQQEVYSNSWWFAHSMLSCLPSWDLWKANAGIFFYQSTPSPLVPLWGYEFMCTEEQKSICRTLTKTLASFLSCIGLSILCWSTPCCEGNHRWCTIPILLVILAVIIKPFFAPSTVFFTGSRRNVFHLVPQLKYLLISLSSFSRKDSQDEKQTWSPWNACTISQLR